MINLPFSDLLFMKHTVNTCLNFHNNYHFQSRATQRAGILKRFGVEVTIGTLDRAIKRIKERFNMRKLHRSGSLNGNGYSWKTSLTYINWAMVLFMWRLGELTKEMFEELKRLLGIVKNRGAAKLEATPPLSEPLKETGEGYPFLVPT